MKELKLKNLSAIWVIFIALSNMGCSQLISGVHGQEEVKNHCDGTVTLPRGHQIHQGVRSSVQSLQILGINQATKMWTWLDLIIKKYFCTVELTEPKALFGSRKKKKRHCSLWVKIKNTSYPHFHPSIFCAFNLLLQWLSHCSVLNHPLPRVAVSWAWSFLVWPTVWCYM